MNEDSSAEEPSKKDRVKREESSSLKLVARKANYKKCVICGNLYLNLPDHVQKYHNIARIDASYDTFVRDPPAIPRCYTKCVGGKVVALEGEELETAKVKFGEIVAEQKTDLELRKSIREDICQVREKMKTAEDTERQNLFRELEDLNERYKNCRYPDTRKYSEQVASWKVGYIEYLKKQNCKDSTRVQRMAMDVFLNYEKDSGVPLTYEEISKPITIKNILLHFRESEDKSFLSKLKYIGQFSAFLEYLLVSIDSPANKKDGDHLEMAARQFTYQQIQCEIKKELCILNKLKGKDMIKKKEKAKNKIVSDEEMDELLQRTRSYIYEISDQMKTDHLQFDRKEIMKIRDSLIAVATVRLGRRSLEMTRMTLHEVEKATVSVIDGETYHTINVSEQKNTYTGEAAPVVYDETEFFVLTKFIEHLRSNLTSDANCKVVFPAICKSNSKLDQSLGLPAAFKILQKFQTSSGKKISSRSIRGSIVSNSREKKLPEEHLNHLAKSMNHSRSTADKHYDYSSINSSIAHVLSKSNASNCPPSSSGIQNSTPNKSNPSSFNLDVSDIDSSTEVQETLKRKTSDEEDSSLTSSRDETLIQLRSKKVKFSELDEVFLKREVQRIISDMEKSGTKESLISKNGIISVIPINKELPSRLKTAPTRLLRFTIKEFL